MDYKKRAFQGDIIFPVAGLQHFSNQLIFDTYVYWHKINPAYQIYSCYIPSKLCFIVLFCKFQRSDLYLRPNFGRTEPLYFQAFQAPILTIVCSNR